jgi:predicted nucleic acid-binding protein
MELKIDIEYSQTLEILIAATAIKHNMKLARINKKYFERIDELKLV